MDDLVTSILNCNSNELSDILHENLGEIYGLSDDDEEQLSDLEEGYPGMPGMQGEFCRSHSAPDIIEKTVSGTFVKRSISGRVSPKTEEIIRLKKELEFSQMKNHVMNSNLTLKLQETKSMECEMKRERRRTRTYATMLDKVVDEVIDLVEDSDSENSASPSSGVDMILSAGLNSKEDAVDKAIAKLLEDYAPYEDVSLKGHQFKDNSWEDPAPKDDSWEDPAPMTITSNILRDMAELSLSSKKPAVDDRESEEFTTTTSTPPLLSRPSYECGVDDHPPNRKDVPVNPIANIRNRLANYPTIPDNSPTASLSSKDEPPLEDNMSKDSSNSPHHKDDMSLVSSNRDNMSKRSNSDDKLMVSNSDDDLNDVNDGDMNDVNDVTNLYGETLILKTEQRSISKKRSEIAPVRMRRDAFSYVSSVRMRRNSSSLVSEVVPVSTVKMRRNTTSFAPVSRSFVSEIAPMSSVRMRRKPSSFWKFFSPCSANWIVEAQIVKEGLVTLMGPDSTRQAKLVLIDNGFQDFELQIWAGDHLLKSIVQICMLTTQHKPFPAEVGMSVKDLKGANILGVASEDGARFFFASGYDNLLEWKVALSEMCL